MKPKKRSVSVKEEPGPSSRRLHSDSDMSESDDYTDDSFICDDDESTSSGVEEALNLAIGQFERNLTLKTWRHVCLLYIMDILHPGILRKLHERSNNREFKGGKQFRRALGTLSRVIECAAAMCMSGATQNQLLGQLKKHPDMSFTKKKDNACSVCGRARLCKEEIVLSGQYDDVSMKTTKTETVKSSVGSFCRKRVELFNTLFHAKFKTYKFLNQHVKNASKKFKNFKHYKSNGKIKKEHLGMCAEAVLTSLSDEITDQYNQLKSKIDLANKIDKEIYKAHEYLHK